jgi:hypothetical protein
MTETSPDGGGHNLLSAVDWRVALWWRQGGQCAACWRGLGPVEGLWHAHHRQRRRVLGNCPCNGVALHPTCHVQGPQAVHDQPERAQRMGLIVPAWYDDPATLPIEIRWPWRGFAFLDHDGSAVSPTTPRAAALREEVGGP